MQSVLEEEKVFVVTNVMQVTFWYKREGVAVPIASQGFASMTGLQAVYDAFSCVHHEARSHQETLWSYIRPKFEEARWVFFVNDEFWDNEGREE